MFTQEEESVYSQSEPRTGEKRTATLYANEAEWSDEANVLLRDWSLEWRLAMELWP